MTDATTACPVTAHTVGCEAALPPRILEREVNGRTADPLYPTRHPLGAAKRLASRRGRDGKVPPGPRGLPGIGVWHEYQAEPYEYIRECSVEYGDVFRLPLPMWDVTVFNHPQFVEEILCDRDGTYTFLGPLEPVMEKWGASVTILEGPRFKQRRRSLTPMFSRRNLTKYADVICEEMTARIDAWDRYAHSGEQIDLVHELAGVTLPAFLRSMYSTTVKDEEIVQIDHDIRMLMRFAGSVGLGPVTVPPNPFPFPGRDSVAASYARLRRIVNRLIDDRLANPIEGTDLLGLLLEAREADGSPIPRKDQVHELIFLMGGGFDTVVNALAWTFALLSKHPDHTDRFYAEVDEVLGGGAPTIEDLCSLTWTKACFDEGQRLQGGPLFTRYATRDVEVAGFPIRKGGLVGVAWHTMHRDPRWWPDPDTYDPTRFTDMAVVKARPKHAFIPFGAGAHQCLGTGMAYMNAQFIMSLIAQRYTVTTPDNWEPEHEFALATGIKGGLPVALTRREESP